MADVKDDKYIRAYDKQLRIGEKKEIGAVRSFYKQEYNKGVDQFLNTGKTSGFTDLFKKNDFDEFYESIYVNIGLRFASWYADNIDKYITKQLNTNNYKDTWETAFAKEGKRVAAVRVVTVQGTAKTELEKTLKKLMTDADFQSRGAVEKGRILRQRFNKLGRYQAERIVRTEATNAANLGVMQSATDVYGKNSLQKKWITSLDGRERSAHAAANGQVVDFNAKFTVGGEMLDRAGDPAGSAANVVNCRCAIAPFPKAEAQTITPLTGFDFGLSAGRAIGLDSANAVDDILKPKPQPVREAIEETRPKAIIPDELQTKIDNGWDIGDLNFLDNLADENIGFNFVTGKKVSSYNRVTNEVNIVLGRRYTKKGKNLKNVLAHEYGHALHYRKGWITGNEGRGFFGANIDDFDKDIADFFKATNKKIRDLEKTNPRYIDVLTKPEGGKNYVQRYNKWFFENYEGTIEKAVKKYGYTKELAEAELGAMADFFGAITKNRIGYGHSTSYYTDKGIAGQLAEMFANAHEIKYADNRILKEMFPELYDDIIAFIDKMINRL